MSLQAKDRKTRSDAEDVFLSVVIPSFNEGAKIGAFLREVQTYLKQQHFRTEIVVVDDASTDSTYDVLRRFSEFHPIRILRNSTNSGKGYSVKEGVMASRGRFLLVVDADRAYAISSLNDLLTPLLGGKYDIAVGNRRMNSSRFVLSPRFLPYVYFRHLLGEIFNIFTRMVVLKGFTDTQCGFKCFSRKAAVDIFGLQRITGFCFDVEVLFLAAKRGYRCVEVPVTFYYNGEPSSIRLFPDALHFLLDLVRIRFNNFIGRYNLGKNRHSIRQSSHQP
jgi:dolichyl-phosphate beta-glucosyltransferase